nr:MAG TPA: hypothetical protein [Bacteriophage sp.]
MMSEQEMLKQDKERLELIEKLIKSVNDLANITFSKKIELLPAEKALEAYKKADSVERELQVAQLYQETIDRLLKVAYTKGYIDKEVRDKTVKVQETYDIYFTEYVEPLTRAFSYIQEQNKIFEEFVQELSAETLKQEIADAYQATFNQLKKDKSIKKRVDEIFDKVDTYGKLIDKQLELNILAKERKFNSVPVVAEVKLIELNKELQEKYQKQLEDTNKR